MTITKEKIEKEIERIEMLLKESIELREVSCAYETSIKMDCLLHLLYEIQHSDLSAEEVFDSVLELDKKHMNDYFDCENFELAFKNRVYIQTLEFLYY